MSNELTAEVIQEDLYPYFLLYSQSFYILIEPDI
jgi:hypothetical protein